MRILVAEDDEGLREVLVLGLTDAGYHVDAVERGDDAIDQLKWYEYDVAVIDWRMPGAEGIDVVAWARKHDRPDGAPDADRPRHARRPDPRPGHRRGRLPRQALRLRGAARPGPRAPAAPARRGRARCCAAGASPSTPSRAQVTVERRDRALTATEYRILELLLRRSPAVVDRKAIAEHAWADETDPLGSNAIDVQLSRLRAKLPDAGDPDRHRPRRRLPAWSRSDHEPRAGRPPPVDPRRALGDARRRRRLRS